MINLGKYVLKNSIDALKIYNELITIANNTGSISKKSEALNLKQELSIISDDLYGGYL